MTLIFILQELSELIELLLNTDFTNLQNTDFTNLKNTNYTNLKNTNFYFTGIIGINGIIFKHGFHKFEEHGLHE